MKKQLLLAIIVTLIIISGCTVVNEPNITEQEEGTTIQTYANEELKYTFEYPLKWTIDTSGLTNSVSKQVQVYPKEASMGYPGAPTYFDIHLDDREISYLLESVFNDFNRSDIEFSSQKAYQFIPKYNDKEVWIVVPYKDLIYVIWSTKNDTDEVQDIIKNFKFI